MKNSDKIILDLCGAKGNWSADYKKAGYNVIVLDIKNPISCDVRLFKSGRFVRTYGILAATPCTHFSSSGARWWEEKGDSALIQGLSIADACMRIIHVLNPLFWALENPVGRLRDYLGPPVMYFNPCDYGDPWTKKTCLWGKFNKPKKNPIIPTQGSKLHKLSPSKDRAAIRSITPPGFAKAFFEANK